MARILALDYGTKRTGIAVTDPLQIIASPLTGVRSHDLIDFLTDYFAQEEVETVVLGYPLNADGEATDNTQPVEAFANRFRKVFPDYPLVMQDESFSSREAMESMIQSGTRKKQRRNKLAIDQVSATIILQSYLESKS